MSGYIEGISRDQVTLFPDRLEDWIDDDHPVRVIDAFVDAIDLAGAGFGRKERRITRWKHEHLIEAMYCRMDENPTLMRTRRCTVEHPFGTIKAWMGSTHFKMRRLTNVRTEMALHVLAYNIKRMINMIGTAALLKAVAT